MNARDLCRVGLSTALIALSSLKPSVAQTPPVSSLRFNVSLVDENGEKAWAGPSALALLLPEWGSPAKPLMKFATSADGDIAGWRVRQMPGSSAISPKIPMVWVRDASVMEGWVPVRLMPVADESQPWAAASATGCVRMRAFAGGPALDELFIAGWSELEIGSERLRPMLWRVRKIQGVWTTETIQIESHYTPEPTEPPPAKVAWPTDALGSAWCTNAIEICHAPNSQGAVIPWLVVYAAQGFPCRNPCTGMVNAVPPAAGVVPMRFVVEATTLRLNTNPPQAVFPIPWTLTESFGDPMGIGYPAILDRCPDTPIACDSGAALWMRRSPRSITVRPDGTLDVVRSGYYWNATPDTCFSPFSVELVGPSAGSMVHDSVSGATPAIAQGPHLLGANTGVNEAPFVARISGHVTRVLAARGIQLDLVCDDEFQKGGPCWDKSGEHGLLQPYYSDHMESALLPGAGSSIDSLVSTGWRRLAQSPNFFQAMAWLPRKPTLPIEEGCGLIAPMEEYSKTVVFQQPPDVCGPPVRGAWSFGVEYVRKGESLTLEAVGGSCVGPLWWNGADLWSYEILLAGDPFAAAHTITPAGEIVVVGNSEGTLSPIRVLARGTLGDITGDGRVDAADLGALLAAWGTASPFADLNADGIVDSADLATILSNWT